jgi:hypothetical protein
MYLQNLHLRAAYLLGAALWLTWLWSGCGTTRSERVTVRDRPGESASCPAHTPATTPLPGVQPQELTLDYWLQRYSHEQLDTVLMDEAEIRAYNERVGRRQGRHVFSQRDLRLPMDALELAEAVRARLGQLRSELSSGKLVGRDGRSIAPSDRAVFEQPIKMLPASLRALQTPTLLRCGPYQGGLYKSPVQLAYDRNACGIIKASEPVELLGQSVSGMWPTARSSPRYSTRLHPTRSRAARCSLPLWPRSIGLTGSAVPKAGSIVRACWQSSLKASISLYPILAAGRPRAVLTACR